MDEDNVTVTVVVPESEPVAVPESEPVVVVVDDSDNSPAPVELDHESRITALELWAAQMRADIEDARAAAESAEFTADVAADLAAEAVETNEVEAEVLDEVAADSLADDGEKVDLDGDGEPDVVPSTQRKHWLFRSWDEIKGGK